MSPQANSIAIPKRLPLLAPFGNRTGKFNTDSRLINCYAERGEVQGEWQIEKRPGLGAPFYNNLQGVGRGMTTWVVPTTTNAGQTNTLNVNLLFAAGGSIYAYSYTTGLNLVGSYSIYTDNTPVAFLQIPNPTTPYMMIWATGSVFYLTFPPQATQNPIAIAPVSNGLVYGIAYLNGWIYVMDIYGNVRNSDNQNDPTSWSNGLNVIVAGQEADYGVAIAKQATYIVALKSYTTQFFYDAGNAVGSPLAPVPNGLLNYGCKDAATLQSIDGLLFWVTSGRDYLPQIIMLDNLQPQIISTPEIDRELLSTFNGFYSCSFKRAGHRFYVLSNTVTNVSMAYDIDQKLWFRWTDALGNCYPIMSVIGDVFGNSYGMDTSGVVYPLDADYVYPTDNGAAPPVDIYTPNFDGGTKRTKYLPAMYFDSDQVDAELQVRVSDDDYQTWSNFRSVDLNQPAPQLTDCGSFVRRAYHFRHQAATPLRIRSVDLQLDLGTL